MVSPSTRRILLVIELGAGIDDALLSRLVNKIRDEVLPRASNIPCTISSRPLANLISVPIREVAKFKC